MGDGAVKIHAVASFQNKLLVCNNGLKPAIQDKTALLTLVEKGFLQLALQISRHSYVFDTGKIPAEGPSCEVLTDEKVKNAYLSRQVISNEQTALATAFLANGFML